MGKPRVHRCPVCPETFLGVGAMWRHHKQMHSSRAREWADVDRRIANAQQEQKRLLGRIDNSRAFGPSALKFSIYSSTGVSESSTPASNFTYATRNRRK